MTRLLQQAFDRSSAVPQPLQDAIAALVLAEIESEKRWSAAFADSQDALAALAKEALDEHRAGHTRRLDPDASIRMLCEFLHLEAFLEGEITRSTR